MSPTFKIDIGKEMQKRVLDPDKPVKDLDGVIELGMYNASRLGNHDDFKFLDSLKNVEMTLFDNSEFKRISSQMAMVRKQLADSTIGKSMQKIADMNKALVDNPQFKALAEGQKQLREQALKLAIPSINIPDAFKRVHEITISHQRYHDDEGERMQLEVEKSEMDMHKAQLEQITLSVKSKDAIYVSDFYKQHVKNDEKHIIRDKTKDSVDGGITYKHKQKLIRVRKEYDRLILTKTRATAKNMIKRKYGWTLGTLEKNLTKGKKLLQK